MENWKTQEEKNETEYKEVIRKRGADVSSFKSLIA